MNSPLSPGDGKPRSQSDAVNDFFIFIDAVMVKTKRPARHDIPFMPPNAFDLPPMPEKPKKKPDDGLRDEA